MYFFSLQPNCHGQTKVFRLLHAAPTFLPLYFTDSNAQLIHVLPSRLRPHLIFESPSSAVDLSLLGLIVYSPEWSYASLFYHSRLDLWIFIDSRRVLPLHKTWSQSQFHSILHGFRVVCCFYCTDNSGTNNKSASDVTNMTNSMRSTTLRAESTNSKLPCSMRSPIPTNNNNSDPDGPPSLPTKQQLQHDMHYGIYDTAPSSNPRDEKLFNDQDTRIYENWPLDSDSGQGSEFSSNSSTSTSMGYGASNGKTSAGGEYQPKSNRSSIDTQFKMPLESPSSSFNHGNGSNDPNGSPKGNNNFATVRRRFKYQGKNTCARQSYSSMSLSVPDLRMALNNAGGMPIPPVPPQRAPQTQQSLPPQPMIQVPIISPDGRSRSSSEYSNKKVSFNCEVTLLDDPDDEYIPHPIFQQVLQKLQKQQLGFKATS